MLVPCLELDVRHMVINKKHVASTSDIRSRTVHSFEDGGILVITPSISFVVLETNKIRFHLANVSGRGQTQTTDKPSTHVGKNVT